MKRREAAQGIPLKRERSPEEVAWAVLFLASPRASYLVGEDIEVNGRQWMG